MLDALKTTLGSYRYAGQFQERPAPAGGGMLKRHWWRFWQPKNANLPPVRVRLPDGTLESRLAVELPDRFDQQVKSWGMAFKDTKIRISWLALSSRRQEQTDFYWIKFAIS